MAIPFLPSEEDEPQTSVGGLCAELSEILTRIEDVRRTNGNNRISRLTRVCCNVDCTRRMRRVTRVLISPAEVAVLNRNNTLNINLERENWFASTEWARRVPSLCTNPGILSALAAAPDLECGQWIKDNVKFPKSDKCIESNVCTVIPNDENRKTDWQSSSDCSSVALLSKILPYSLSSSLWTAVICVVGWQLLRAR